MSSRGIVITNPFTFDGKELRLTNSSIDPSSLRQYLLYWDKMEWPDNNVISMDGGADIEYLKKVGVLERTPVKISFSGNIGYALIIAQEAAFRARNKSDPGNWSLAQQSDILVLPDGVSEQTRLVEVELYSMIPVPIPSVPLEEILIFKEKRQAELHAFRDVMDDLYESIIAAEDIPRAKTRAIEKIELCLGEVNRVFIEKWPRRLLSSLKIELNLPSLARSAIDGAAIGLICGAPPELGAAIGAMAAAVKIDFVFERKTKSIPDRLKPYAYLHRIEMELK